MPPDVADSIAPNQRAPWWKRLNTWLYILAGCAIILIFVATYLHDGTISRQIRALLLEGGALVYLSIQLVKVSGAVQSMPIASWTMRFALVCYYALFLGLIGMFLVGLLLILGVWPGVLHTRIIGDFDTLILPFFFSFMLAFFIVHSIRGEVRVSAWVRRYLELRANEPQRP